jgi:transcriptional regulator with XRE-family HTH domain
LKDLRPTQVFANRLREVRDKAGLSQEDVRQRLEDMGYELSRSAIAQIELGRRRVTLDEALALAVALGVAPVHLMVPFEDEAVISEDAADDGIFEPTKRLKVGNLLLLPFEARQWIRGTAIYPEAPLDLWHRFYCVEVPPAVRYRLRQLAAYARAHKERLGRWTLPPMEVPAEERTTEMAVPGFTTPKDRRGFPAPIWTWLMNEKEERR